MAMTTCKECGAQVSTKAESCPSCGAKIKPKRSLLKLIMIAGVSFFLLLTCVGVMAGGSKDAAKASSGETGPSAAPPEVPPEVVDVKIQELIGTYDENELKGDQLYKGKIVRTSGKVSDVKNDVLNQPFVTVGTGKQLEIRQVQCSLTKSEAPKAADLKKGQEISVRGEVRGLMMNVQFDECVIE